MNLDPDTGLPDCQLCHFHWWRDRPVTSNWTAYITRYHITNGHKP